MNSSDNLISLSDSGVGPALSTSLVNINPNPVKSFDLDLLGMGSRRSGESKTEDSGGDPAAAGGDLLIDFSDEVEVPQQTGIMLQAEIDDTFGIFSKAQQQRSSQQKAIADKIIERICDEEIEDEAAKLVRSFTSGRKSDGVKVKKKQEEEEKKMMDESDDKNKKSTSNDSNESIGSDHPTIVDSDEVLTPGLEDPEKEEDGIMEEQMKMDDTTTSSNLSGGSDSDYLDIRNLSSFSIPDGDENLDENKFIEDIKKENMSTAIAAKAVVTKIKLEMIQDDVDVEEEDNKYLARANSRLSGQCDILSEISRPCMTTSTVSRLSSVSVSSSVSTSSRMSTRSRTSSSSGFGDVPVAASSFMHQSGVTEAPDKPSTRRFRISSNFGSPIRASYPVSKYFMPTPNAKTPSTAASKSRVDFRDKLSESLYSPSRTRVMLITGDSHRSPSRVPVRKSISAETLHFEYNSPVRDTRRHVVKFSTPSAASRPSRHSFCSQPRAPNHPNLFGDDFSDDNGAGDHDTTLTDRARAAFMEPRLGRLSYATTASNSSVNTLSPPTSSIYSRDLSVVTNGLNGINLCESPNKGIAKATAIIAPTAKSKPMITSTTEKPGLIMPAKLNTGGGAAGGGSLRPIAASSPKIGPSPSRPSGTFQTTPSRSRYGNNVRSSGYGTQQNLNSTFGHQQPLKSPNKTVAAIKPPAIPKSLKTGVPSLNFNSKLEMNSRGGGVTSTKAGVSALKPVGKMSQTGLRRPTTAGATLASTSGAVSNKENKLRPSTTVGSRIAMSRQGARH